jgi:BirA family transcriptional regulator, biotin operon repressor / biotin---[acetyl-CoA-carboxylase] ligase
MSLVLRGAPEPLSLLAGVAVCEVVGDSARVKWPNDIVVEDGAMLRKLAGILVEGRPQDGWAVLGIGVNVAVRLQEMPCELAGTAATLGLAAAAVEPVLVALLGALARRLAEPTDQTLSDWGTLDVLRGREVSWGAARDVYRGDVHRQRGRAEGIDGAGRLIVAEPGGRHLALDAGEVHLLGGSGGRPSRT